MTIYNVIENPSYRTSYTAHTAGALAGLLLGVVLLENRRVVTWEVNLQRVTVSLYIILLLVGILWHIVSDITSFFLSIKIFLVRDL